MNIPYTSIYMEHVWVSSSSPNSQVLQVGPVAQTEATGSVGMPGVSGGFFGVGNMS